MVTVLRAQQIILLKKKTGLICETVEVKSGVNNILIEVGNVSAEDVQESNF